MNEPLMHAIIAFAARCGERDSAPSQAEAQQIARDVAAECGLDACDAEALRHIAKNFVAPREASPQDPFEDLLEDLSCLAVNAPDYQTGEAVEPKDCPLEASGLSPEAALFDAAENFAERLDVLIRDHNPQRDTADVRFSAWTFVAVIEDGTALAPPLPSSVSSELRPAFQKEQKLLRFCDFYTRSHARPSWGDKEIASSWLRILAHGSPAERADPHETVQFLTSSRPEMDNAARIFREMANKLVEPRKCTQTLYFFEHNPEHRSWPTKIDWNIDAMLPEQASHTLEAREDDSDDLRQDLFNLLLSVTNRDTSENRGDAGERNSEVYQDESSIRRPHLLDRMFDDLLLSTTNHETSESKHKTAEPSPRLAGVIAGLAGFAGFVRLAGLAHLANQLASGFEGPTEQKKRAKLKR